MHLKHFEIPQRQHVDTTTVDMHCTHQDPAFPTERLQSREQTVPWGIISPNSTKTADATNELALSPLRSPQQCEPPGALLAEGMVQLPSPHEVPAVLRKTTGPAISGASVAVLRMSLKSNR